MAEIKIRPIKKDDIVPLGHIISDTWGFGESFSEKPAFRMGKLYLAQSLNESNFCRVAEIDGEVSGLITARADKLKRGSIKVKLFLIKSFIPVLFNTEALGASKILKDIEALNKRLYKASGKDFSGEIPLFVMKDSAKGKGVGGRLYGEALEFMKANGTKEFFIYTDTTCDYGFYDHKGAKRLSQEDLLIPL